MNKKEVKDLITNMWKDELSKRIVEKVSDGNE